MGLADVKRAIEEKTKAEVDAVLAASRAESERILADAKEQIAQTRQAHDEETKQLLAAMERREHAASVFERKTTALEAKRAAIDGVLARVREQLDAMGTPQREQILGELITKAQASQTAIASVMCNTKDQNSLRKAFPQATVTVDDAILGGFLADDDTGSVRLDYTYDTILAALSDSVLAEITERLFSRA